MRRTVRFEKPLILSLCILLMTANAVFAQTDTPTPIPTWTPDVFQYWTVPAPETTGTPDAVGTAVAFGYAANFGDVAISVLLSVLIFVLWAMFIIWLLLNRKES